MCLGTEHVTGVQAGPNTTQFAPQGRAPVLTSWSCTGREGKSLRADLHHMLIIVPPNGSDCFSVEKLKEIWLFASDFLRVFSAYHHVNDRKSQQNQGSPSTVPGCKFCTQHASVWLTHLHAHKARWRHQKKGEPKPSAAQSKAWPSPKGMEYQHRSHWTLLWGAHCERALRQPAEGQKAQAAPPQEPAHRWAKGITQCSAHRPRDGPRAVTGRNVCRPSAMPHHTATAPPSHCHRRSASQLQGPEPSSLLPPVSALSPSLPPASPHPTLHNGAGLCGRRTEKQSESCISSYKVSGTMQISLAQQAQQHNISPCLVKTEQRSAPD